jgi:glycosyltransferase involved in cell wall biosynthesis
MRLAVLVSHPIQYYSPLFRELASRVDLHVYFGQRLSAEQHAKSGFGVNFQWDIDLLGGYPHTFLHNRAAEPGVHFAGCDTPEIGSILRKGQHDVLLVTGWYLKCFAQATWSAKRMRLPVIVRGDSHLKTPRSWIKTTAKTFLYPPLLRLFNAACYPGQESRQYFESYGYPSNRLFFSPHCVDTKWFADKVLHCDRRQIRARYAIAEDAKVLLFAGRLVPFKRPNDLIAAAAKLRGEGRKIEVMIVGDGALRLALLHHARDTGVPLHLCGFVNQTEMPAAYAASDLLVLPSSGYETWGLVANEAQACGKPIIVSDACGCAADLVADKVAGLAYPAGNIKALAKAICTILDEPPTRNAIAQKVAQYSIDAAASGIQSAAEDCVQRGSREIPGERV